MSFIYRILHVIEMFIRKGRLYSQIRFERGVLNFGTSFDAEETIAAYTQCDLVYFFIFRLSTTEKSY